MAFMKKCSSLAIRSHVLSAGGIASTDAIKTISSFPVTGDGLFLCQSAAVRNSDHTVPAWVEVGVQDGMAYIPVRCQSGAFPPNTSMNIEYPFLVGPGQRIYAKINNPHAGDYLSLLAFGVILEKDIYEARSFKLGRYFGRRRHDYGWR